MKFLNCPTTVFHPLWPLSIGWPLALLVPLVPYIPKQAFSTLAWQQELWLAICLAVSLLLTLAGPRHARGAAFSSLAPLATTDSCLLWPLALFVAWSATSMLWTASVVHTLHYALVWTSLLLFLWLMRRIVVSPRLLRVSCGVLAVTLIILSFDGMIEFWGTTALHFRYDIGLGEPTAVAVPLFVALALHVRRRRATLLCGATATLCWLTTLQTLERAPTIGAGAALLLLALTMTFAGRRFRPRHGLARAALLLCAILAATALQTFSPALAQPTQGSMLSRLRQTQLQEPNVAARLLFWSAALEMWREHPLLGVGASNYEVAFADARRVFAARHPDSPLVGAVEDVLPQRTHNEYLQILAELGAVGGALFAAFALRLGYLMWQALRYSRQPLIALGACGSLLTFALSSGASSVSFRCAGSALLCFFAVALVLRGAADADSVRATATFAPLRRRHLAAACACAFLLVGAMSLQAVSSTLAGSAQQGRDQAAVMRLFETSLCWNPFDPATHYNYGTFLVFSEQMAAAVPHLRYASTHGFNAATCYVFLATAERRAGDEAAAEATLQQAIGSFPRSVSALVYHAVTLQQVGRATEAEAELRRAEEVQPMMARGWYQLLNFGLKAATTAANRDSGISPPGALMPESSVMAVLDKRDRQPEGFDTVGGGMYVRVVKQQQ